MLICGHKTVHLSSILSPNPNDPCFLCELTRTHNGPSGGHGAFERSSFVEPARDMLLSPNVNSTRGFCIFAAMAVTLPRSGGSVLATSKSTSVALVISGEKGEARVYRGFGVGGGRGERICICGRSKDAHIFLANWAYSRE